MRIVLCLLLLSTALTGCATFRSPDAVIAVDSSPQGADIYQGDKKIGTTPDLIKVDRKSSQKLELRLGDRRAVVRLTGRYRFKASFWPNFAFLSLAPVGWITDFVSGSAWDYKPHYSIAFDGKTPKRPKPERMRLAIAPPKSNYSMFSDELGARLETHLKREYPEYEIIPYQSTVKNFVYHNFDYDRDDEATPWPDVFYEAKADVVYTANIDDKGPTTSVKGAVYNAYSDKPTDSKTFIFLDKNLKTPSEVKGYDERPVYFYILPNTVALDLEQNSTSLDVNGKNYSSTTQHSDDLWGQVTQYISVIALRRYQPPTMEKLSRWRFAFNPSVLISHNHQKFEDSPELRDLDFTLSHVDLSYGPQYTFSVKMWQFYGSLMASLSYDRITVDNQIITETYDAGNFGAAAEFGAIYFFTPKWSTRLAVRSVSSNDEVWEKAIRGATGINYEVAGSGVNTAGFSFAYTFSDYIHPGRR